MEMCLMWKSAPYFKFPKHPYTSCKTIMPSKRKKEMYDYDYVYYLYRENII